MADRGATTEQLAGAMAGVALALIVAACTSVSSPAGSPAGSEASSNPSSSSQQPSPSEPRVACAETMPVEGPTLTPGPSFLPPGSRARVVLDGLCIREGPSTASPVVGTLSNGAQITIEGTFDAWGPVAENGFAWYLVYSGEEGGYGWAAGEHGGTRYLDSIPPECPADRDLATVLRLAPWERLSCFDAQPLELRGVLEVYCQGGARDETSVYEPDWLAQWCFGVRLTDRASPTVEPTGWMQLAFSPSFMARPGSVQAIEPGTVVRLIGHFDDPAASTCRVIPSDDHEWSQAAVQVLCREQFVVTGVEGLGHMDLPPAG